VEETYIDLVCDDDDDDDDDLVEGLVVLLPPIVFLLLQGVPSKRDVGKLQRKGYKDAWVMSIDAVAI
jgi:hypothetical protein